MKLVLIIAFFLNFHLFAKEDELDRLSLAALLIKNGHYARAENVFKEIKNPKDDDEKRYYTLKGLLLLSKKEFEPSLDSLLKAKKLGQKDPELGIYLAQAAYGAKKYEQGLEYLELAKNLINTRPKILLLKANLEWQGDLKDRALLTLEQAKKGFPSYREFHRQKILFLMSLKLYQTAMLEAKELLQSPTLTASELVFIVKTMRAAGENDHAVKIIEMGLLRFPLNEKVLLEAGVTYLDSDCLLSAARQFELLADLDPKYMSEASEIFRQLGRPVRAMFYNSQILDQKLKLKQRLALLIEAGRFEQASFMDKGLSRNGLLKNEDIRYALAYAYFKVGDYKQTELHLKKITRQDLFEKANGLRKNIEQCADAIWTCL